MTVTALYHVPRNQVWEGSCGKQSGRVHLTVDGRVLCGKRRGWYERDPLPNEQRCERCEKRADRERIEWPA